MSECLYDLAADPAVKQLLASIPRAVESPKRRGPKPGATYKRRNGTKRRRRGASISSEVVTSIISRVERETGVSLEMMASRQVDVARALLAHRLRLKKTSQAQIAGLLLRSPSEVQVICRSYKFLKRIEYAATAKTQGRGY